MSALDLVRDRGWGRGHVLAEPLWEPPTSLRAVCCVGAPKILTVINYSERVPDAHGSRSPLWCPHISKPRHRHRLGASVRASERPIRGLARNQLLRRHRIEPGEDQHNVGLRVGGCARRPAFTPGVAASRRCPRSPTSGSASALPASGPRAFRRRACPITRASQ
jgi:hypothetical protein